MPGMREVPFHCASAVCVSVGSECGRAQGGRLAGGVVLGLAFTFLSHTCVTAGFTSPV